LGVWQAVEDAANLASATGDGAIRRRKLARKPWCRAAKNGWA